MGQSRFLPVAAALLGAVLAGCKTTSPALPDVHPSSQVGTRQLELARGEYMALQTGQVPTNEVPSRYAAVQRMVDEAIALEPGTPTFVTVRGQLWFDQGRLDAASAAYDTALASSSAFVPAWIGAANVAIVEGNRGEAQRCLDSGRRALGDLSDPSRYSTVPEQPAGGGVTLSSAQRRAMLLGQMREVELWAIDVDAGEAGRLQSDDVLLRRLQAQVALGQAILDSSPADADAILAVDAWMPGYYAAVRERAERYLRQGRPDEAIRLLSPYIVQQHPRIGMDYRFNLLLSSALIDSAIAHPNDKELLKRANLQALRLIETPVWKERAESWVLAARARVATGSAKTGNARRRDAESGLERLKLATELANGRDVPMIATVDGELRQLLN